MSSGTGTFCGAAGALRVRPGSGRLEVRGDATVGAGRRCLGRVSVVPTLERVPDVHGAVGLEADPRVARVEAAGVVDEPGAAVHQVELGGPLGDRAGAQGRGRVPGAHAVGDAEGRDRAPGVRRLIALLECRGTTEVGRVVEVRLAVEDVEGDELDLGAAVGVVPRADTVEVPPVLRERGSGLAAVVVRCARGVARAGCRGQRPRSRCSRGSSWDHRAGRSTWRLRRTLRTLPVEVTRMAPLESSVRRVHVVVERPAFALPASMFCQPGGVAVVHPQVLVPAFGPLSAMLVQSTVRQ